MVFSYFGLVTFRILHGLLKPEFTETTLHYPAAQESFDAAKRKNFTYYELIKIQFVPPDPMNLKSKVRLDGKVVVVKAGYSFIEVQDFPRFLCPGSKYNGLILERDMVISFTPAFSAKGGIAINPEMKRNH